MNRLVVNLTHAGIILVGAGLAVRGIIKDYDRTLFPRDTLQRLMDAAGWVDYYDNQLIQNFDEIHLDNRTGLLVNPQGDVLDRTREIILRAAEKHAPKDRHEQLVYRVDLHNTTHGNEITWLKDRVQRLEQQIEELGGA